MKHSMFYKWKITTTLPFRLGLSIVSRSPPKFVMVLERSSAVQCKFYMTKWPVFPSNIAILLESLYACFAKEVIQKSLVGMLGPKSLEVTTEQTPLAEMQSLSEKNNFWENSMFLLTFCQGWWRYQSNSLPIAIYGRRRTITDMHVTWACSRATWIPGGRAKKASTEKHQLDLLYVEILISRRNRCFQENWSKGKNYY